MAVNFVFQLLSLKLNKSLDFVDLNIITYTISAILIAASGYLINGYYDREIDKENIPDYLFPFSFKKTLIIYFVLNIVALFLGFFMLTWKFTLGFLFLPILTLWLYSFSLKKLPLIGNISIAFLAFWLPIGILHINNIFPLIDPTTFFGTVIFTLLIEIFLITFSREITKDIEDELGDKIHGAKTLAIIAGPKKASYISVFFLTLAILLWINVGKYHIENISIPSTILGLGTTGVLLAALFSYFAKTEWKNKAKIASLLLKISMLTSLLTATFV